MKTTTRLLLGAAAGLMLGLCACSSDEPTPGPDIPDPPVMPEHPAKDWKGELPHGFITDATVIDLPVSDRGYLIVDGNDEIVIDQQAGPSGPVMGVPKQAGGPWDKIAVARLDGKIIDPFENTSEYVDFCASHLFRVKSQFTGQEKLQDFNTITLGGYYITEGLTSVDVVTEKYFDKNHPAGSSMKTISTTGISYWIMPGDYILWSRGETLQGPGLYSNLGSRSEYLKNSMPVLSSVRLIFEGYPEKAGEYPMTLRVTMNGGEKVLERKFVIKYVDKK